MKQWRVRSSSRRWFFLLGVLFLILAGALWFLKRSTATAPVFQTRVPLLAIAYYGPHASLERTLSGLDQGLRVLGWEEGKNLRVLKGEVQFQPLLLPALLLQFQQAKPAVVLALTTPVAQTAKRFFSGSSSSVLFGAITDPERAGLQGLSGVSDAQDLEAVLDFAVQLLGETVHRVGLLYATAEANDQALLEKMQRSTHRRGWTLVAVPIEEAREIPLKMQVLKGKVDFLYVGVGGTIQPSLPSIAGVADRLKIPVLNADSEAVQNHEVLASFGVDYFKLGEKLAPLVDEQLQFALPSAQTPDLGTKSSRVFFAESSEHRGFVSLRRLHQLGRVISPSLKNHSSIHWVP